MISWAGGMWKVQLMCSDPHGFWQLTVKTWGEREWKIWRKVREEGKLCNWWSTQSHMELPRCWDVYVISNFSSTFAIPAFLLCLFNICQFLCAEWQREGLGCGGEHYGLILTHDGGGSTARSVDGLPRSLCATKDHFLSRASRLIPNRPLSQALFYSAHCMGVPEGKYYTLFLDMFPKAYILDNMIYCRYFKNTAAKNLWNNVPISLDNLHSL